MDHAELKILMLEDIAADAGLIERALRQEGMRFNSLRVDTREDFLNGLENFKPDLVLSDHGLPLFNSIEALQLSKAFRFSGPFILVTGTVSEEFAVSCLKQGADDYILKSNLSRLPLAIANALNQRHAERKKMEAEETLKRQNEVLARTNDDLVKTNIELDSFVYSVSHNLRAPLASVFGLINIINMEITHHDAHFLNYLDMMNSSLRKLDDTLQEILEYSQNSRGEIVISPVNLGELVVEAFDKLRYIPAASDMELNINGGDLPLYSDRYRLTVLLNCLLSNASKFSDGDKGAQTILVELGISDNATLKISDNGIGIKQELLPKVFKMFYRASERSDGAGLGLYIAKEIVAKLKGTISIDSRPGEGTTVSVVIPNETENFHDGT
jgi:signal transduction histidine kinase